MTSAIEKLRVAPRALLARRLNVRFKVTGYSGLEAIGKTKAAEDIEGVLHELCHAAVFGIRRINRSTKVSFYSGLTKKSRVTFSRTLSDIIGEKFDAFDGDSDRESDLSEAQAAAVELLVARQIELEIDEEALVSAVRRSMRQQWELDELRNSMERRSKRPESKVMAERVVRWMVRAWEQR